MIYWLGDHIVTMVMGGDILVAGIFWFGCSAETILEELVTL